MSNQLLYPNIISNPQRNANTTVQASTLMGGNLAQVFNLQALRTIKGRVVADGSTPPVYNSVINEYDGSPVRLYDGDVIIALSVSNGNATPDNSASPYIPDQFTAGTLTLAVNANAPTYTNGEWVADNSAGTAVSANFTFGQINSGKGAIINAPVLTTAVGSAQWLQGNTLTNAFTGGPSADGGGFVHVTLLVMNPSLAQ